MIRFNGVTAGYGSHSVLRDVSIHLAAGSFHFLTGPSGAGKSTLFRLIRMELWATRGLLSVFGQDVSRLTPERAATLRMRMGSVLQDNPMLKHLTVFENVSVPLLVLGKKMSDFADDVKDLLEWVGLGDRLHSFPRELSGGQLARVGIARASINKPELLLADEPTAGLDAQMARRVLRLFIELNRLGTTVLIATHDQTLMRQTKMPRVTIRDGLVHMPRTDG